MLFNSISKTISIQVKPCIKFQHPYNNVLLLSSFSLQSYLFTTTTSNQPSFTLNYLINSCGVSPESALSVSKHLDLSKTPNTADSVIALLTNQGLTKSQVSNIISGHPRILLCDPDNTLLPNFKILNSLGLSSTDIGAIVTAAPKRLLCKRFQETALSFLKSVLESDDRVINAIKRYPLGLTYDLQVYAAGNIRLLQDIGVPKSNIVSMLTQQPRTFFTSAVRFRKVVEDVMEMGFDPSKTRFLYGIHAIRAMSKSTWGKKIDLYKKWGWSKDEIFIAFEKYPGCMMASTEKISRILEFLFNTMGWEKDYIFEYPIVISFSLEKRIIPRCLVYQYLAEKGLTEDDVFCFNKWLVYSDTKFLKWVVKQYADEGVELLKVYNKHLNEAMGSTNSKLRIKDVI
ncbi:transcription termination factor MTERF8, chloroplastic-like [Rutidosis leptorrhynchoides]|uniref:transcription termination factor MTERF8, chloroplastic-like n=1 Tax=Rutidosis leptorrhynchoides TaxID=125765 RepID=UPI003A9980C4